jgi:helicase required for RNAi-mediated heterochromatin assembly 1
MLSSTESIIPEAIIRDHVLKPYNHNIHDEAWRNLPEIPDKIELMPEGEEVEQEEWDSYQKDPTYNRHIPHNIVDRPWDSKEDYLRAHYQILREDAIASLRNSIKSYRANPDMAGDDSTNIYTEVSC